MHRLSAKTKANYFLTILWIVCGFVVVYNGEAYGSIIYKFFASAVFLRLATYYLLIDFGKVNSISKRKER